MFLQLITAIYHSCINMYHIFHKKRIIQKQKTQFIGYPAFTGKQTKLTNTDTS